MSNYTQSIYTNIDYFVSFTYSFTCLTKKLTHDKITLVVCMNTKNIIKGFLIISAIGIAAFLLQDTFAKYRKKVNNDIDINLASWNIRLNGESIAGKDTISSKIKPIFEKNEYIAENVLAPGVRGYYDIDIDASEVDTSFSYLFTTKISDEEKYPDIIAFGYTIDPDHNSEIIEYTGESISGSIIHNTASTKIRIYIKWDDSETNLMTNTDDTALAISKNELTMNAEFKFEQLKE